MFNGVEMKNGENEAEYIKRVLDEMNIISNVEEINNIIHKHEEEKKPKKELFKKEKEIKDDSSDTDETISDCSSSDDDTDETISDSVSELNDEQLNRLGLTYFKRVMLGTYDCSMEEHDDAVRWFNNKYGTEERGSNGSKGHYFTHGERPYNLFKMAKLKSIYDRKIKSVSLYNVKVHITFIDPTDDDYKTISEYTNILKNFRSQRDSDRHIELKDCLQFMNLMDYGEVEEKRDYNHQKTTVGHKWNIGDIVFNYKNPHLKNVCYWTVIKITSKMLKIKALEPILTVKHESGNSNKANLIKYKKDKFLNDVKTKYVFKNTHNSVYIMDDYFYRMFKEA